VDPQASVMIKIKLGEHVREHTSANLKTRLIWYRCPIF
jgi:hypothetical protein